METYRSQALDANRIIRQLALEWIQSQLPTSTITFVDCLKILSQLHTSSQNISQVETIFEQVFYQANVLGKSSEWVAVELKFEALAQGVSCRAEVALHCLKQDKVINDDALDQYNERISRFTN